jgi:predicted nucleic acid-binding protein
MELCLIDTSSWIEALREDGDPAVRQRVADLLSQGRACLCDMILLELWNGARGDYERGQLAKLEKGVLLLPTDDRIWSFSRELARSCRSGGVTVPATDLIVYACAKTHGTTLEHNDDHFQFIERAIA